MLHHHAARVARQTPGRFGGNARAAVEDGLAGLIGVGEHRGVDVDHHLIALARGAGVDTVMERRLCEQRQSVGLLLLHKGRFRRNVPRAGGGGPAGLLVQRLASRGQRLQSTAPTSGASRPRRTTMPSSP